MRQNGYIDDREYAVAVETPLKLVTGPGRIERRALFRRPAQRRTGDALSGYDFQTNADRIYTTLDMDLQRAANEAVGSDGESGRAGPENRSASKTCRSSEPQCALIALDPHTGEIKALVGGRNYGVSQFNRVLAKRPPGSIFKPFVYAAAMNTAVAGGTRTLTPASIVVDEPTTF